MTGAEAVSYIEEYTWSKTRLGLDRTRELLDKLGNPQNELSFIHVAGSNGKGSVCAMLESILRKSGLKTGLYTSPYLIDFSEQLQINGKPIDYEELAKIVEIVAPVADAMEDHPSRFEILTAVGMLYFKRNHCDIVVLEVGMGGEMDSTNVIPAPICACIMNIGIEHSEFLGDTIEKIAATKAGIIKPGTNVVCYNGDSRVVSVVQKKCEDLDVPISIPDFSKIKILNMDIFGMKFSYETHRDLFIPIVGTHQLKNAAVVLTTIDIIRDKGFIISENDIINGLKDTKWPARFQILRKNPLFILDGGHNPQCAQAVVDTLNDLLPNEKFVILFGMLADKDHEHIIRMQLPHAKEFICVTPDNPRAISAIDVAAKIGDRAKTRVCETVEDGIRAALETNESVLCLGSLYVAGTVLETFVSIGKSVQRHMALAKRDAMTIEEQKESNHRICESLKINPDILSAKTIFSYMAIDSEVDLEEFHNWAIENGKRLCFPVVIGKGKMEAYSPNSLSPELFETDRYGIKSPITSKSEFVAPSDIDVVLTPCVAFDDKGRRLGHGGGFYDRYLPQCINSKRIIIAHKTQRLAEVIVDDYDICNLIVFM